MQSVLQAYQEMPPVTRAYTTACVITTLLVQLEFITPFHLYFNWQLVVYKFQWWRIFTSFCYFGSVGFTFFFNIIFTYRHCLMLEEGSFRGRTADFVFMFMFGAIFMIISACFVHLIFLGHAFTIMLVYVWSRRNPMVGMNFFGLLSFNAPYLPWVLLLFSLLLGNNAMVDIFGIACGHMYYFLEDVFPNQPNGFRVLETPAFLKWLFDPAPMPHVNIHERPGGYNWGNIEDQPADDNVDPAGGATAQNVPLADGVEQQQQQRPAEDEAAEAVLLSETATHSSGTTAKATAATLPSSLRQRNIGTANNRNADAPPLTPGSNSDNRN